MDRLEVDMLSKYFQIWSSHRSASVTLGSFLCFHILTIFSSKLEPMFPHSKGWGLGLILRKALEMWERRHGPVTLRPNLDSHLSPQDLHRRDIYTHQTRRQWFHSWVNHVHFLCLFAIRSFQIAISSCAVMSLFTSISPSVCLHSVGSLGLILNITRSVELHLSRWFETNQD